MRALALALVLLALGCAGEPAAAPPPSAAPPPAPAMSLRCAGAFAQGGVALCRTAPMARIYLDGALKSEADADGWVIIGFDRDAAPAVTVRAVRDGADATTLFTIAPRDFQITRVDGLPAETVTPTAPEVLAKIKRDTAKKNAVADSRAPGQGWLDGFSWPVQARVSSPWGAQRVLNGTPARPHYGVDLAAPTGTEIRAPADGVVTLSETDMHFEGGLVFIDHGQGLISMYLHMSRVDVAAGDAVVKGQPIGRVGAAGRATGPHLCWRMRWRDQQIDPTLAVAALDAARVQLDP